MPIKNGKINNLNVLGIRRVDFPAHHFTYINIPKYNFRNIEILNNWIRDNLSGRYYIGQSISLTTDNVIIYTTQIGFENDRELSFFTLACQELTRWLNNT